jgi:hypothetical protein
LGSRWDESILESSVTLPSFYAGRIEGMNKKFVACGCLSIIVLFIAIAVIISLSDGTDTTDATPAPTPTIETTTPAQVQAYPTYILPTPTPTIQEVVDNSDQYDCCIADDSVQEVEAAYDSSTGEASVYVIVSTSWPQSPVDVGKALIYQYEASIWTSPYHPSSVTVVIHFTDPTGAMDATVSQETASTMQWQTSDSGSGNPWDYWSDYDTTDISPSLGS